MQHNQAKLNTHFAHIIFSCLKQHGIESIFVAPGSRSSPLALASFHYATTYLTHFDERSLAFMALGKIKADKKPCICITTSGSACGNLLPALMEAHAQNHPLILITADRPQELHERGSNQTTKQADIFRDFTTFSYHLEAPKDSFNERALISLVSHLAEVSKKGPVHLNIALHEPLFDPSVDFPHDVNIRKISSNLDHVRVLNKKGFILLGEQAALSEDDAEFYEKLSVHLDAPIIADISSGFRSFGKAHLFYHNFILDSLPLSCDYILHFGTKFVSKPIENFIKKFSGIYYHVGKKHQFFDPFNRIDTTLVDIEKKSFFNLPQDINPYFRDLLYSFNKPLKAHVKQYIDLYPSYEEAEYIDFLSRIDSSHFQLFIGNSLPIRHMDSFYFPEGLSAPIYTQRGLSGIDGLISTACGLSLNQKTTLCLLGDLSSLYDASALSLISQNKLKVIPIVFNNHGGGIFSHLPIAKQTSHFEKIIATTHTLNFKDIAHGFDLDHILISSLEEFESFLKNPLPYTLLEIVSSKEGNVEFLDGVKKQICSFVKQSQNHRLRCFSSTASWDHM